MTRVHNYECNGAAKQRIRKARRTSVDSCVVYRQSTTSAKKRISITLDASKLKRSCVEMAAIDATPYRFFEQMGFKHLTEGMQRELNIAINRKSVGSWVEEAADHVKFKIANLLKNKMFNVVIDAASRFGRSVLSITAQLVDNAQIKLYCLGLVEMSNRHTARNIAEEVKLILALYNLELSQVYSVSSDNASNMLSVVRLLTDQQKDDIRDMVFGRTRYVGNEMDSIDDDFDYFNAGYGKFSYLF